MHIVIKVIHVHVPYLISICVLLYFLFFLYFYLASLHLRFQYFTFVSFFNPLNPELNPICYLLALLAHRFLHISRIRVKSLTLRLLMSYIYIYMERIFLMFLDHTTTQHSR